MRDVDSTPSGPSLASRLPALLAIVLVLLFATRRYVRLLLRDQSLDGDLRQHVFWGQRAWGADLLAVDPIARFQASDVASPPLWRVIVQVMGRLGEIQMVAELAGLGLFFLTSWLMWRLFKRIGGGSPWVGLVGVAACGGISILNGWMPGGLLQRGFSLPITVLAIYALHARQMIVLGLCFLAAALLYPITIISIGAIAVVYESWRLLRDRRLPRYWWVATICGVIAMSLILFLRNPPAEYGPVVTYDKAMSLPSFGPDGRNALFLDDPIETYFDHHRTGLRLSVGWLLGGLGVIAVLALLAGRDAIKRLPPMTWLPAAVGLVLFVIAHLTLFMLYLPNRHVVITLPLSLAMVMGVLCVPAGRRVADWWKLKPSLRPYVTAALWAVYLAMQVKPSVDALRNRGENPSNASTYAYLQTTPPDTLIAGLPLPDEVDDVPLRTGRPVLVNYEVAQPYYPQFFETYFVPRLQASFDAYYATDWATVDQLADVYGVDVFLFRAHMLDRLPQVEPMRQMAIEAVRREVTNTAAGEPVVPVMYQPPKDRVLWRRGDVTLIRVGSGPASGVLPGVMLPAPELPPVDLRGLLQAGDEEVSF